MELKDHPKDKIVVLEKRVTVVLLERHFMSQARALATTFSPTGD
jgi:hypothetical protein